MSSDVPYGRVVLNEVEQLKREMKRMEAEHRQELTHLSNQLYTLTAEKREVDSLMNNSSSLMLDRLLNDIDMQTLLREKMKETMR